MLNVRLFAAGKFHSCLGQIVESASVRPTEGDEQISLSAFATRVSDRVEIQLGTRRYVLTHAVRD